jgi:hypothetical protein
MSAEVHPLPIATRDRPFRQYAEMMFGGRVQHRYLRGVGRMTGYYTMERGVVFVEVQIDGYPSGPVRWLADNCLRLGPIPFPCPRGAA